MKRNRLIRLFKKLHKWPSILIAFFAIIIAFSGIILNHRQTLSSINISRKLLPPNYRYTNWNQAAVRGAIPLDSTNFLLFGTIGIWKTNREFNSFSDYNSGFGTGIDNRKIYAVTKIKNTLFAGTQFGLFKQTLPNERWEKINLPVRKERIADLGLKNDTLLVLTRHYLLKSSDGINFTKIELPAPVGYERKTGLFDTFLALHSGELFGLPGKLIVDLLGLVTILLSITGLLHFFFPKIIRLKKKRKKPTTNLLKIKKKNLRWHNVAGYIFAAFLFVNTFFGMHLRPPLLIAIANKQVGILPGTHLDSPNPWFDKLRRVHWDENLKRYIFSTSEGFFLAGEKLQAKLQPVAVQPPVSIMGCNVLKSLGSGNYLVGSFSGMFIWNIANDAVYDFFTRQPYVSPAGMARAISENMVTGIVETNDKAFWFDYNRGALKLTSADFPKMPDVIRKASPMSLWNTALELHTGRIFESLIGPFYILFIPLAGICILIVLLSGFFMWWLVYRKK